MLDKTVAQGWRLLAYSVIERAILDVRKADTPDHHKRSAEYFLNNTQELDFFADVAGCTDDMRKLGYLE